MQWQSLAGGSRQAWALVALLAAAGLAAFLVLPEARVRSVFWEGGPVERLTEWLYVAGAVLVWFVPGGARGDRALRLAFAVTMLAAAAREADWHKRWTGTSVLRVSYYYGDAPATQRAVAAVVVVVALVAIGHLLRRAWRGWWPALRRGEHHAATVAVLFVTLLAGKLLDRSRAVLAESFGIVMAPGTASLVRVLEETLELSLPLLALLAVVQYFARPAPPASPR